MNATFPVGSRLTSSPINRGGDGDGDGACLEKDGRRPDGRLWRDARPSRSVARRGREGAPAVRLYSGGLEGTERRQRQRYCGRPHEGKSGRRRRSCGAAEGHGGTGQWAAMRTQWPDPANDGKSKRRKAFQTARLLGQGALRRMGQSMGDAFSVNGPALATANCSTTAI
ncbi:hypothetical protein SAMN02927900_02784 [Rhizobium mongolense subsp. loessense]|uniref:Uncharacterized protein n=1 Tax=Rhizobium mongolense subsp. loessense TaxID=158890 RepID=A0A1G4RKX7_9HYPH|nr:hypothetical protein SAMN02927900_02784 [Rhizobium mongolense subsp. loessense]